MSDPRCSCGSPLVCFSELAGRDELLSAAKYTLENSMLYRIAGWENLQAAIKLAESRHPVEVAK